MAELIIIANKVAERHGHLASNQMLKNVAFLNQKIEMLRKTRVSKCKNQNV